MSAIANDEYSRDWLASLPDNLPPPDFINNADWTPAEQPMAMQGLFEPPHFPMDASIPEQLLYTDTDLLMSLELSPPLSTPTMAANTGTASSTAFSSPGHGTSYLDHKLLETHSCTLGADFPFFSNDLVWSAVSAPASAPAPASVLPTIRDNFTLHAFPPLATFAASSETYSVDEIALLPTQISIQPASGDKLHHCSMCDKTYPTPSRLSKHMKTHTRPFQCDICQIGHGAKKDLDRHMWTTHPEDAQKQNIPSQKRVCPKVGCLYEARQDNLARHVRTKHPELVEASKAGSVQRAYN